MFPTGSAKKYLLILSIFLLFFGLSFFMTKRYFAVRQTTATSLDKTQVTTSFYPTYFFAQQIGGSFAQVVNLTPAGTEPHDYEPSPQQMAQVEQSKLLILNGGGVESWADKVKHNVQGKSVFIVTAGDNFQSGDPHVWLSPVLAKQQVQKILQGFQQVDPQHLTEYTENARQLTEKLDTLDQEFRTDLKHCSQRNFVTSHSAFGYLAREYGLTQVSISGLSPDAEPSPSGLAEVATFAKQNNVKVIFFERLVSPKLSETIAKEAGAQTAVLNPLEGLTEEEVQLGQDYFSVMRENLSALRLALECQ